MHYNPNVCFYTLINKINFAYSKTSVISCLSYDSLIMYELVVYMNEEELTVYMMRTQKIMDPTTLFQRQYFPNHPPIIIYFIIYLLIFFIVGVGWHTMLC